MEKNVKIKGLESPVSQLIMGTAWLDFNREAKVMEATLEAYVAAGGNTLDTGRFYGGGAAEKILAKWLDRSGLRGRLLFTSKAGHYYVNEQNEHFPELSRVRPDCIAEDLDFSLDHLGLDHFDIFMMHRDNPEVPVAPLIDQLEEQHRAGRIRAYGLSNWTLPRVGEALEYAASRGYQGISVLSPSYSLATVHSPRWPGCEYVNDDYALAFKGTEVVILPWGAQGGGYFSETWTRENAPAGFADCYFNAENEEKLKRAKELARKYGALPVNIALAYLLNQGLPIAPVIGPRSPGELAASLRALDIRLSPAEVDYLALRRGGPIVEGMAHER
ncbi:MAG: aldo/keto reductase [Candidatus Adiutrix sp.]|jgi:aryl-alcohol dehydrogenase-like predicted oxidoreductase|nr:aldo/keto reductase [Candidatus Adiutrix sp.]